MRSSALLAGIFHPPPKLSPPMVSIGFEFWFLFFFGFLFFFFFGIMKAILSFFYSELHFSLQPPPLLPFTFPECQKFL